MSKVGPSENISEVGYKISRLLEAGDPHEAKAYWNFLIETRIKEMWFLGNIDCEIGACDD